MTQVQYIENGWLNNPLDEVEDIAAINNWSFTRAGENDVNINLRGHKGDYQLNFSWVEQETLHLSCAFNIEIKKSRIDEIVKLISLINKQLMHGHFDLLANENSVMFRHAIVLHGGATINQSQIEFLFNTAKLLCEKYVQAFEYIMWPNCKAKQALEIVNFETVGRA